MTLRLTQPTAPTGLPFAMTNGQVGAITVYMPTAN